jgi:hypothetical protein
MQVCSKTRPLAVLAAMAGLLLAGCGGAGSTTASAKVQRFCELQAQLAGLGQKLTAPLEKSNASPAQFRAADRKIVESPQFKELQKTIPAEIKKPAQIALAALRGRAGAGPPVSQAKESAAIKQVQQFAQQNCG